MDNAVYLNTQKKIKEILLVHLNKAFYLSIKEYCTRKCCRQLLTTNHKTEMYFTGLKLGIYPSGHSECLSMHFLSNFSPVHY